MFWVINKKIISVSGLVNTFLFLFSNKMLVIRAGIYKMLISIAHREDSDQTFRTSLIWVCAVCLDLFSQVQVFKILEHLPYHI